MTLGQRRAAYVVALLVAMPLSGWAGSYAAWRWLLGDDTGTAMATFWDLQVESYVTALLFVAALDLVYGLHRRADGGWGFAHRGWRVHAGFYAALIVLVLICSAEGPWRQVLQVVLPDDIGASVAHYFRRALEAVLAVLGLMAFLDVIRPGGLRLEPLPRPRTSPAAA